MAEQPHARLYHGLPPVVRQRRRRWLIAGACVAIAASAVAVMVIQALYSSPAPTAPNGVFYPVARPDLIPPFDRYSLIWIGGAFIAGGLLGVRFARGWWPLFAVDAVGLALGVALILVVPSSVGPAIYGWFFWVLGASAGSGVRGRMNRRRLRMPALGQPG